MLPAQRRVFRRIEVDRTQRDNRGDRDPEKQAEPVDWRELSSNGCIRVPVVPAGNSSTVGFGPTGHDHWAGCVSYHVIRSGSENCPLETSATARPHDDRFRRL